MLESLELEVTCAKSFFESETRELEALKAERAKMTVACYRLPINMVRKFETLKVRIENAQYIWDKACDARNALRALIAAGKVEI